MNVFACSSTAKSQNNKRRLPFDSAYLKGVEIPLYGIFVVARRDTGSGKLVWGGIFAGENLNGFACNSTTKSESNKRRLPFDSAYLKGADIPFHGVLIIVSSDTGDDEVV